MVIRGVPGATCCPTWTERCAIRPSTGAGIAGWPPQDECALNGGNEMGDNTASMIQMLSSPDFIENPYPAFARIRQQEPICFLQPFNAWLLPRFEDVQTAFTDDRFQIGRASCR